MVWDSYPVNISQVVSYECMGSMRLSSGLEKDPESVKCLENNKWDTPAQWEQCVESKKKGR